MANPDSSTSALADEQFKNGNYKQAADLYKENIKTQLESQGADSQDFHLLLSSLYKLENWSQVEQVIRELLPKYEACEDTPDLTMAQQEMVLRIMMLKALEKQGKTDEAREAARSALERIKIFKEPVRASWDTNIRSAAGGLLLP